MIGNIILADVQCACWQSTVLHHLSHQYMKRCSDVVERSDVVLVHLLLFGRDCLFPFLTRPDSSCLAEHLLLVRDVTRFMLP